MTWFSENPTKISEIPSIPIKADDNRANFPCSMDQPQIRGYSQTQMPSGAHSSEPIVINDDYNDDDDNDNEFLQEGHHSPESRGIDFLVNSPKSMTENLRGSCRQTPQNGRLGLRQSSWGFRQGLQNHRHQTTQSSGTGPVNDSTGTVQPHQQHDGQSTERNIGKVPSLHSESGLHPGRNLSSKETAPKGTWYDPTHSRIFIPGELTLETSAQGRAFSRECFSSTEPCEETVLSVSHERMATTAPFDGLDDTTIAASARSYANVPDTQQISDAHILGVDRSETSDMSQRTVLGSLPLDYPLGESFIVDASAPASTQLPDLHNNPTEPVNFWSTGRSPSSLRRQKLQHG